MHSYSKRDVVQHGLIAGSCRPLRVLFILAAIFSKRFIEDLYSRVVKAEKDAKEALTKTDDLVEIKSEVDNLDEQIIKAAEANLTRENQFKKEDIERVIDSIQSSKFSFRTVNGISKELGLPFEKVNEVLNYLKETGFAGKRKNSQGIEVWRLKIP